MEVLGARGTLNPGRGTGAEPRRPRLPRNIESALDVLGAEGVWSKAEIRRRYRALVKQLHPDMNGGDRSEEGRLRKVLWAWDQIKNSRGFEP
jgi:DnaJ-domain-containing protein 1